MDGNLKVDYIFRFFVEGSRERFGEMNKQNIFRHCESFYQWREFQAFDQRSDQAILARHIEVNDEVLVWFDSQHNHRCRLISKWNFLWGSHGSVKKMMNSRGLSFCFENLWPVFAVRENKPNENLLNERWWVEREIVVSPILSAEKSANKNVPAHQSCVRGHCNRHVDVR